MGGRGPVGGGVVFDGWRFVVVAFGVIVLAVSSSGGSMARVAAAGRGQSSGVSGYSVGFSAMCSSGGLLPKALGRLAARTSESDRRASLSSESDALYHIVPCASITTPGRTTRGVWPGK